MSVVWGEGGWGGLGWGGRGGGGGGGGGRGGGGSVEKKHENTGEEVRSCRRKLTCWIFQKDSVS